MKLSALKKRENISNNPEITKLHKKRNYTVNLSRNVEREYFQKHMPQGASSKSFCNLCKPFFSNKTANSGDKNNTGGKSKGSL